MARLVWDADTQRLFETGVSQGVLFPMGSNGTYEEGVAWNGLTAFNESPDGGEPTDLYADNIKYLSLMSTENFKFTIEAYTYPDAFAACDGSKAFANGAYVGQQARKKFGFCCKTQIGNDVDGSDHGYKLHIVYGCLAAPSDKSYDTINDSPDAITFSWEVSTTPVDIGVGFKKSAHIVVDSTKVTGSKLTDLENWIYGSDGTGGTGGTTAAMPTPAKVLELLGAAT